MRFLVLAYIAASFFLGCIPLELNQLIYDMQPEDTFS